MANTVNKSRRAWTVVFAALFVMANTLQPANSATRQKQEMIAIVIHAGAGTIDKSNMTPGREKAYKAKLREALLAGYTILETGGNSLDAVQAAIVTLEDSPLFNAGKGAVYTNDETHELDASIMDGATLNAGAVSGVKTIANPIKLARAVMEKSGHVMLSGSGAEAFAAAQNMPSVGQEYFHTRHRLQQLREAQSKSTDRQNSGQRDRNLKKMPGVARSASADKFGTVGAVALDSNGNLAAGTSTGGMTNKRFGRIGDSPVIGAGTYADNRCCGVSATGHGEYFIRAAVAHDICARKRYKNISLQQAADEVVQQQLVSMGGEGGVVALDRQGNVAVSFNTPGMYRAAIDSKGNLTVEIYK